MLEISEVKLQSRLFLGTARYPSVTVLQQSIIASGAEVITVSLRRQSPDQNGGNAFWNEIKKMNRYILPNTAGCRTAKEAVQTALMAREIFDTNWIKLEVFGDEVNLQPDPFELYQAAKILIAEKFEVFPYCTEDLVLCQKLVDCGCKILMPWGSPIGTGKGLINPYALEVLRRRLPEVILIIDAGIGRPSHAALAMELGFDAVLINSAVSMANNPEQMAVAFRNAITGGRLGYEAGLMIPRETAYPSTPLLDTPFWLQNVGDE